MIVDGESRNDKAIKNLLQLLKSLNATHKEAYYVCTNCLNSFFTASTRQKHHEYCSSSGHVKVKMPFEKEKWLKFYDNQQQSKVRFMLIADFESMVKLVDETYRDKMNQKEKINMRVPP